MDRFLDEILEGLPREHCVKEVFSRIEVAYDKGYKDGVKLTEVKELPTETRAKFKIGDIVYIETYFNSIQEKQVVKIKDVLGNTEDIWYLVYVDGKEYWQREKYFSEIKDEIK